MLSSRVDLLPCLQKEGDGGQHPLWETKESVFMLFGHKACGILVAKEGLNLHLLHWKTKS